MEDRPLKIALVHDFLVQDGGAERVLACFQRMFPAAPTFALIHDPRRTNPPFKAGEIRTSFLDRMPLAVRCYQWYVPFMPLAVEQLDFTGFDLVISSSSLFAKGVIVPSGTRHVCYCHTPTRFLWQDRFGYLLDRRQPWIMRALTSTLVHRMRPWDLMAAERPDAMLTNSKISQERIQHFYGRSAQVMHPPVDVEKIPVSKTPGTFWLAGGRLVPYKRFDLAVKAFTELGWPLKIFGNGPEMKRLKKLAGPTVEFLGHVSDEEKFRLYGGSIAYLHPQIEDFGITAVEAMAAGKPVIAYGQGGALETVMPGMTGEFMNEQTPAEIIRAVRAFRPETYDPDAVRRHAERYSAQRFEQEFRTFLSQVVNKT